MISTIIYDLCDSEQCNVKYFPFYILEHASTTVPP